MPRDKRTVLSPLATADLRQIWRYHADVASRDSADKVLRNIRDAAAWLNRLEVPGRPRDDLLPGLRAVLVHPHIIFFRLGDNRIEIVRVLHERRDLPALFDDDEVSRRP